MCMHTHIYVYTHNQLSMFLLLVYITVKGKKGYQLESREDMGEVGGKKGSGELI